MMLALGLVVALAAGQVAGVCSAGKDCSVRRIITSSGAYPQVQTCSRLAGSSVTWGWYRNAAGEIDLGFGNDCNVSTGVFYVTSAQTTTSATGFTASANGYVASLAFASFPTCNAGTAGRLLYDSTNNVWRYCINALGWVAVQGGSADVQTIYSPANVVTNNPIAQWSSSPLVGAPVGTSINLQAATVLTAGVGAGNITYTVYDLSAAANTTAAVTIACTTAAGTVTTGSTDSTLRAFPNNYQLRVTASACATNPVVNVTVRNVAY